jgi:hypothetical protein
MTIWFNHFRQRLVIITQSHFGINKPGPVLSDCTPLCRAEEFYLSHNGVTGKSKTFWLLKITLFHFFCLILHDALIQNLFSALIWNI